MTSITEYIEKREQELKDKSDLIGDFDAMGSLMVYTKEVIAFNKQTIAEVLRMVKKEMLNDDWEVENEYERGFVAMMHKALAILGSIEKDIINNSK